MANDKDYSYESLVNRKVSLFTCFLGILQLLISIFLLICAFIFLSGFCEGLSCQGVTDGLGFWIGFPLMIPALLSVVVLATRHVSALVFTTIANFIVAVVSIVHVVVSHNNNSDYWKPALEMYNDGKCHLNGFRDCFCTGSEYPFYPFRCDLMQFGHETNWIMFGLGIAAIALTFFGVATGVVGYALQRGLNNSRSRK